MGFADVNVIALETGLNQVVAYDALVWQNISIATLMESLQAYSSPNSSEVALLPEWRKTRFAGRTCGDVQVDGFLQTARPVIGNRITCSNAIRNELSPKAHVQ